MTFLTGWLWAAMQMAQPVPGWADAHLAAARDDLRQARWEAAAQTLEALFVAEPRCSADAYSMLAKSYREAGDMGREVMAFERGIAAFPDSLPLLKSLGQALFARDMSSRRAGEVLQRAVGIGTRDAEAHYLYGQWNCANNQEEVCIAELSKAAQIDPGRTQANMQIYGLIAMAEDKLNRPQQAEADFRRAMTYNRRLPRPNPELPFQFSLFLAKNSRDSEARKLVEETLRLAPGFGPARLELARFLVQDAQLEAAVREAEKALELAGRDSAQQRAAHAFLAKTYHALGQDEKAVQHQEWVENLK